MVQGVKYLSLAETLARMDAGMEPTGMYSRRVSVKGGCFISLAVPCMMTRKLK